MTKLEATEPQTCVHASMIPRSQIDKHVLAQVVHHGKQTILLDGDELLGTLLVKLLDDARLPSEELDHANNVHTCRQTGKHTFRRELGRACSD